MAHELVEYFAVRQDETLALLRRLVEFESPSNDKAALDRLGAFIADQPTRTVKGLVPVQAPPFTDYHYGDWRRVEGRLQTPVNLSEFDYREYLARQGVYSVMYRPSLTVLVRVQGARQERHCTHSPRTTGFALDRHFAWRRFWNSQERAGGLAHDGHIP